MDLQHFPILTSSIEPWESLQLWAYEDSADLVWRYQNILLHSKGPHPIYSLLAFNFDSSNIVHIPVQLNNLSHLRLGKSALDCECIWRMLRHFRGTVLDLSSHNGLPLPRDEPPITFPNLQILRLQMHWNDILRLLPLLDALTHQILDLHYSRSSFNADVEWLFDRLLKLKLPLLAMRNADGLDRFFQSPAIQAIPLVRLLGVAVMVEHWILGTFVGWNRLPDVPRDLAHYLYGEIPCECASGSKHFYFFLLEEMKKVDNRVLGNRWWPKQYRHFSRAHRRCSRQLG